MSKAKDFLEKAKSPSKNMKRRFKEESGDLDKIRSDLRDKSELFANLGLKKASDALKVAEEEVLGGQVELAKEMGIRK